MPVTKTRVVRRQKYRRLGKFIRATHGVPNHFLPQVKAILARFPEMEIDLQIGDRYTA
jgi:hypothetical protein